MEQFPGSTPGSSESWSEKTDAYLQKIGELKATIEDAENNAKELKIKLEGTSGAERAKIFNEMKTEEKRLNDARFEYDMINLKKAA